VSGPGQRAGLGEIHAHRLRHTTAMRQLRVIALWLGHVSVETTQIYHTPISD
jgi:integrase